MGWHLGQHSTVLFTDIEGSTRAWETDPERMAVAVETHDRVIRSVIAAYGGGVFATGGDSFAAAFESEQSAVGAAIAIQHELAESEIGLAVRIGVHTGPVTIRENDYFGPTINETARLMSIGHGGQILVSRHVADRLTPNGFTLTALGFHRVSGVSQPLEVYQVDAHGLSFEFPELTSSSPRLNVPAPIGPLVGRKNDIVRLLDAVESHRLVSVVGIGGVGKTRLAIEVARALSQRFTEPPSFVDLTTTTSVDSVTRAVSYAFGLRDRADTPPFEVLRAHLRTTPTLLLVDNCEHLLPDLADVVLELLSIPDLRVIATSRVPLGLPGESVQTVRPLETQSDGPDPSPAVRLLMSSSPDGRILADDPASRAAAVDLCEQVGGLPLAIEIVGRALRLASMDDVRRGVSGVGTDSQTALDAALRWSISSLGTEARSLLARFAISKAGLSIDVIKASALSALGELIDVGLVDRQEAERSNRSRYRMLEPIRQFANTNLQDPSEREAVVAWHSAAHLSLVRQLARQMMQDPRTADLIAVDEPNFTAAAMNELERGHISVAAEIVALLDWYWVFTGRAIEGRYWVERVALAVGTPGTTDLNARAVYGSLERSRGFLASVCQQYEDAADHLQRSIEVFDQIIAAEGPSYRHALRGGAWSRFHLARNFTAHHFSRHGFDVTADDAGLVARASDLYAAAEAAFRSARDPRGLAYVLPFDGWNAVMRSEAGPERVLADAISIAEAQGLVVPHGIARVTYALYLLNRGKSHDQVEKLLEKSASTFRSIGDVYSLEITLTVWGFARLVRGEVRGAVDLMTEAIALDLRQTAHEWRHLALAVAAIALERSGIDGINPIVGWLDHASPNWREMLQSIGLDGQMPRPVVGVEPSIDSADVAALTRDLLGEVSRVAAG